MFVSMNWIKDFVDLDGWDIKKLINNFTLATAEVEDIIEKGTDVQNVVVGEVVSFEAHPDSKKLHLLKIDAGDRVYNCVCGAPNAKLGIKVAFVKAGGRVPEGKITKCKIAGYESEGMCCSEAELGISDDNSGIMILDNSLKNGTDIKDIYEIEDIVFEVDNKSLTNRPDLWGHYGIAREFATLTKQPLKELSIAEPEYSGNNKIDVQVESDLVYRYSCMQISGITKNVSPMNMRIRLYYCGMRGINLLADLTNYLMLELGQPMHAFDGRKIERIKVGTPSEKLKFQTLDENVRDIDENMLLIYNNDLPVAIAGVMGGLDSEIVDETNCVVLESANFDGVSIRKTSSRLGLRTDASMRYEKCLDPEMTVTAIKRFLHLLLEIDPNAEVTSDITDEYVKKYPEITISFNKAYVNKYTGIDISNETITETLRLLGFKTEVKNDDFSVTVPSWRATKDVTIKADIIEEITRIYGYDNFEITTTKSALYPVRASVLKSDSDLIKDILVRNYAMHEVHSYIWCDGNKYKKLGIDVEDNVKILNIATPENGTIRNSMIPSLISFAYDNRQFAPCFGIFESGRVVCGRKDSGEANERRRLGIVLFDKNCGEKELYFKAVEVIRTISNSLRHTNAEFTRVAQAHNWQHPRNTSSVSVGGKEIGMLCTLHPSTLAKIDKRASVVCIEIDLDDFALTEVRPLTFNEPSKFPGVDFDLSILTNGHRYSEIEKAWLDENIPEFLGAVLVDTYEIGKNSSITVRLSFASETRTLSMEEIQTHIDKIIKKLEAIGVFLRA